MEIWKKVKGYEGLYEISNKGRIRSCDHYVLFGKNRRISKGKILVQNTAGSNYNHIKLSKNNIVKRKYIHRLVAEAFIPNPENKLEINHINENTRDNRVDNLEWATRQENINHSNIGIKNRNYKQKSHYQKHPVTKTYFKKVCETKGWNFEKFIPLDSGLRNKSNGSARYYFIENEKKEER